MQKYVDCVFKKSNDVKHVISLNDAGGLVRCYGHTDASAVDLAVRYYEGERWISAALALWACVFSAVAWIFSASLLALMWA